MDDEKPSAPAPASDSDGGKQTEAGAVDSITPESASTTSSSATSSSSSSTSSSSSPSSSSAGTVPAASATPAVPPVIPPPPVKVVRKWAGIYPADKKPLPGELVVAVERLQRRLEMPVWLLLQDGRSGDWSDLGEEVSKAFYDARRDKLLPDRRIAVVIDSNGGFAEDAYEVAKILQRHCGGFVAVIPRHAKSAATLLALGADEIHLGKFGELGPLDVQIPDPDREEWISGLDEVQQLERLHAFVMSALDQTMISLCARTRRKVAAMLPHVIKLVTEMTRPLFESIDVIRYTQMSRSLKVGEEYARRLLGRKFDKLEAARIARSLVENYPVHSFVIDIDEAKELGLQVVDEADDLTAIVDTIAEHCGGVTAVGPLVTTEP